MLIPVPCTTLYRDHRGVYSSLRFDFRAEELSMFETLQYFRVVTNYYRVRDFCCGELLVPGLELMLIKLHLFGIPYCILFVCACVTVDLTDEEGVKR